MISATMFTASCSEGKNVSDNKRSSKTVEVDRKTSYFSSVETFVPFNVHFTQADKPSIKIIGNEDIVKKIITVHNGNTLTISYERGRNFFEFNGRRNWADIYITSPDLVSFTLRGSGNFDVNGKLDTDNLDIELSGSGDMHFPDIICDKITAAIHGSGDIDFDQVRCEEAYLSLMGSGDFDIKVIKAKYTSANLIGSGDLNIVFDNCLSADARLTGSGDINLKGKLKKLNKSKIGSGDIDTDDLSVGSIESE